MDKLPFYQNRTFSSHQNYRDGDEFSFSRILSDGQFQLRLNQSRAAKPIDKVVEKVQNCSILVP